MRRGEMIVCSSCYGSGYALEPDKFGEPKMTVDKCTYCNGSGEVPDESKGK
jgi:DnaJ-class molecular chaperone